MFVLDASTTMAWCFPDEATAFTDTILERLRGTGARVPAIWPLEIANVLLVGERRGRLTAVQSARFISLLTYLPITIDDSSLQQTMGSVLSLARSHMLSAYDAAYLELAMTHGLPLATIDQRLAGAARRADVTVLEL